MSEPILEIADLSVSLNTVNGPANVLDHVGFAVDHGEIMGLVGESGSGKSVTAMTILRLIPPWVLGRVQGSVRFSGRDLLQVPKRQMDAVRGSQIGMVFQSPGTALNPLRHVGQQILEVLRLHRGIRGPAARREAAALIERVGLPERTLASYPHELSGGMQQRAYIGLTLAAHPAILIADEPTSSLDVSVQAQITALLRELHAEGLIQAIIFITHDFGLVHELCDTVTVLYAGQVVESGRVVQVLGRPRHPYTRGLIGAIPRMDTAADTLEAIPGTVPDMLHPPGGCRFNTRCPHVMDLCRRERPATKVFDDGRSRVFCYLS